MLLRTTVFLLVGFILASSADARIFGKRRYRYYYYTNTTANWTVPANDTTLSEVPVAIQEPAPDQVKAHHHPDQVAHKHHHHCHYKCCYRYYKCYKRCHWRRCCY